MWIYSYHSNFLNNIINLCDICIYRLAIHLLHMQLVIPTSAPTPIYWQVGCLKTLPFFVEFWLLFPFVKGTHLTQNNGPLLFITHPLVHSYIFNTTLDNTTTSIEWHKFGKPDLLVRIYLYNATMTLLIRHSWTLKCHIVEVINVHMKSFAHV